MNIHEHEDDHEVLAQASLGFDLRGGPLVTLVEIIPYLSFDIVLCVGGRREDPQTQLGPAGGI